MKLSNLNADSVQMNLWSDNKIRTRTVSYYINLFSIIQQLDVKAEDSLLLLNVDRTFHQKMVILLAIPP